MAAEAGITRYMSMGVVDEIIPQNATHVSVHPSVTKIPDGLFYEHPNIIELICHDGVIKIEYEAFKGCPRLKRVIMNSVEDVEDEAFDCCRALEYVECANLDFIGRFAFNGCTALSSINLPSANTVSICAFSECPGLVDAKFGRKLKGIFESIFYNCSSLQRITLPLRNDLIPKRVNNSFQMCGNLRHVDLIEEGALQETIDALLWEEWKNDMNAELTSIDQILPNAHAGYENNATSGNIDGEKANVLRIWMKNVLRKIIDYKSQHRRLLKEAESRLQLVLPCDIVMNNIVPFFTLPQHTFDGEEEVDKRDGGNESIDESYQITTSSVLTSI